MTSNEKPKDGNPAAVPDITLQGAAGAEEYRPRRRSSVGHKEHDPHHHNIETFPNIEDVPPVPYDGSAYGHLDISQNGMDTGARIATDGRINININQRSRKLTNLLAPALRKQLEIHQAPEPYIPPGMGEYGHLPPPPMNIVIQIVGSRGDVQPFVALGQVLRNKYGHRVRIATHPNFKDFVTDNGLEFFSIGGDPSELMAFMVKNPGLMPGFDSLKNGDVGKRRKGIYDIIIGCWRSCIEAGDGMGGQTPSDALLDDGGTSLAADPLSKPFIADAIIANPPSFAHMHIAEKLGIPLHLMFTMPWSPTQAFPHPLANITNSNADANMANFVTYALVDMLTWQGLGDVINKFREKSLGLEPVSIMWAPGMASRLRIPYTYCWSPALIPKPRDWGNYIDISGFFFLNLSTAYTPPADLKEFLDSGPPPVYIGFGSIVVDDPNAMTKMIFEAVKKTGQRALVSKGWGGLGADEMGVPEGVYMLGNCPHDWLFNYVSCVVHHGGAGTTATGILMGRPTVVVPFFGDQPFWGAMTAKAGAGPMPQPYKTLTADKLATAILEALKPESMARAADLSAKIKAEKGSEEGANSFHKQLHLDELRCSLYPKHVAVWRVKRTDIRLSTLAATVLGNEGLLNFTDLKLYRSREYQTEEGPWDPISGGASALIGTIGNLTMGVADFPVEILKGLKSSSIEHKKGNTPPDGSATRTPTNQSTQDLSRSNTAQSPVVESPRPSISSSSNALDKSTTSTGVTQDPLEATPTALSPVSTSASTQRHASAISTIFSNDGEKHRKWSRHGSRSGSRSGSPNTVHRTHTSPALEDAGHVTMESVLGGASAVSKIVGVGLKSPMDFTMSLAQGFHNAPKLYGDDTVRKSDKITGLGSGITAAGKEFGYGFFDGITGLVTQPIAGAKKEGVAGFFKGAAKGVGGVVLKPGAAIWGLPGYTFKGIYAEVQKHFGSSVQNYIIAARTAQGYEEWKASSVEQRSTIIATWKSTQFELRRKGKKYGKDREEEIHSHILSHTASADSELVSGFKNTRHLSWDERKALAEERDKQKRATRENEANANIENKRFTLGHRKSSKSKPTSSRCKYCPFDHDSAYHLRPTTSFPSVQSPATYGRSSERDLEKMEAEYEEAIKRSVTATSKGDPAQDAIIERAIRASVKELQKAQAGPNAKPADEDAYKAAIKASVEEAKKARGERVAREPALATIPSATSQETSLHEHDDDAALTKALTQSLEEYKLSQAGHAGQHKHFVHHDPDGHYFSDSEDSGMGTEEDENFKKTLEESRRVHTENEEKRKLNGGVAIDGDADLQRAIEESEKLHREQMAIKEAALGMSDKENEDKEHEIVMEYVKKQSLMEEKLSKAKVAEAP